MLFKLRKSTKHPLLIIVNEGENKYIIDAEDFWGFVQLEGQDSMYDLSIDAECEIYHLEVEEFFKKQNKVIITDLLKRYIELIYGQEDT